jgi:predicted DNA repair protein MutK
MPASGLIALLDDIATIADDVATLTTAAAKKTSGIVTDDMAVTAEQAIGIRRERELPVVLAVARGSFINKAAYLAPGALLLNAVAPWSITPLLMAGGAFLCFEGVEKIVHKLRPHQEHDDVATVPQDPEAFEKMRVEGAIRTDLILSAEIIAITLGNVKDAPLHTQVAVLYAISVIMTVGVYGLVAGLVKIDDAGEALVRQGGARAGLGRAVVAAAPKLLHVISIVGTVAMLMVGGQILLHGFHAAGEAVHHLVEGLPAAVHTLASLVADILAGAIAGLLLVGVMATGVPQRIWGAVRPRRGPPSAANEP